MKWNTHYKLSGLHAFMGASKYHWLNYEDDRMLEAYRTSNAAALGTRLHNLAKECIELKVKLPKTKQTLNLFVNDAIGFRMKPEQPLYYSDNCFGTADAISFRNNKLRIHDLKTGSGKTKMDQLYIYAALFCLEYGYKPSEIDIELRIYQNDEVRIEQPDPSIIASVIKKIKHFDKLLFEEAQKGKEE